MIVKIVLQYYAGTRSLYIQEGRQDKGRKTAPRDGARGLSHVRTPPPVRHVRTPPPVRHLRTPIILTHCSAFNAGRRIHRLFARHPGKPLAQVYDEQVSRRNGSKDC